VDSNLYKVWQITRTTVQDHWKSMPIHNLYLLHGTKLSTAYCCRRMVVFLDYALFSKMSYSYW